MSSGPPDPPVVVAAGLSRVFPGTDGGPDAIALSDVDLTIGAGTFVALMGPSGSGKSTLLHILGGLDVQTAGTATILGTDLRSLDDRALTRFRRRRIGFVFQSFNLMPTLTARENVAFPAWLDGEPRATSLTRADGILAELGLRGLGSRHPDQLSGGQQQRVGIARALVNDAPLILADEPTGSLDTATGREILNLLHHLCRDRGRTVVMATHAPEARALVDRVVGLADGRLRPDSIPA